MLNLIRILELCYRNQIYGRPRNYYKTISFMSSFNYYEIAPSF